jgi:hypothetical protein
MRRSHKRNAIAYRERYFVLAISDVNEKVGAGIVIEFEEPQPEAEAIDGAPEGETALGLLQATYRKKRAAIQYGSPRLAVHLA